MEIKPLTSLNIDTWHRIVSGYASHQKYAMTYSESEIETIFRLQLVSLESPYHKQFDSLNETGFSEHLKTIEAGFSFGAYENDALVGIALSLPQQWNNTLWLQEFHIAKSHQGKGIGGKLMQVVIEKAQSDNFRLIYLETQNMNVPAIRFYRKMGFAIESVDLSLYRNDDYPEGEIALFMKYKLG